MPETLRRVALILVAALVSLLGVISQQAAVAGTCTPSTSLTGGGTSAADPLKISSPGDLLYLSSQVSAVDDYSLGKFFELTADLDMTGCSFVPIGTGTEKRQFAGFFEGGQFTIASLDVSRPGDDGVGIFGWTQGATINNLTLTTSTISGQSHVGGIMGYALDTSVTNLTVTKSGIAGSGSMVGGIAGELKDSNGMAAPFYSLIDAGVDETTITGSNLVGGIAGALTDIPTPNKLVVTRSSIVQTGTTSGSSFGGLFGLVYVGTNGGGLSLGGFSGVIFLPNSSSTAPNAGGLVGKLMSSASSFTFLDAYAKGAILAGATANLGGLVGSEDQKNSMNRVYVEMGFYDSQTQDAQIAGYAFTNQQDTPDNSFVNSEAQTSWTAAPSASNAKTSVEMRLGATYSGAGWSIEDSADVIRAGTAATTWIINTDVAGGTPVQLWAFDRSAHDTLCAPGKYSVDGLGPCELAPAGRYTSEAGLKAAVTCPEGTFQPAAGSTECLPAEPGHSAPTQGLTAQVACSGGSYQDGAGQTSCKIPEAGFYASGDAARLQIPCAPGTFKEVATTDVCRQAAAGRYVSGSQQTEQRLCDFGFYQPKSGQTECIEAEPGYFVSNEGSAAQDPCVAGKFQPDPGQASCRNADPGNYVSLDVQRTQVPCDAGYHQPLPGQTGCVKNAEGTFVAESGQALATACLPGTYQPKIGQTSCLQAAAGHFVADAGSIAQSECVAGKYQPDVGQDRCLDADPGHYVSLDVQRAQVECFPGAYQPLAGQTECLQSPAGSYVAYGAQAMANLCPVGTFQPDDGQLFCLLAEPGFFVANVGSTTQTPCPAGYTSSIGASSCTPPGGGGGGGGGGFFPTAGKAEPLANNPLLDGENAALLDSDGARLDFERLIEDDRRSVDFSFDAGNVRLQSPQGRFDQTSPARFELGKSLSLIFSSLNPASEVVVYLIPASSFEVAFRATAVATLAQGTVADDGSLQLNVDLPDSTGEFLLQIAAMDGGGQQVNLVQSLVIDDTQLKVWTKRLPGNTQAKFYAKSVVGAGKVQFYLNGKEIAWVRAEDDNDPKLRQVTEGPMAGVNYLVRTVNFVKGKNALEIYVDGVRVWRAAYALK